MTQLHALSPLGREAVRRRAVSPRLQSLRGKTVCELWNGVFKGDVTFPLIRRELQQRFPDLKIVPYTEFPHGPGSDHPSEQRERARQLAAALAARGADAVISGNGA